MGLEKPKKGKKWQQTSSKLLPTVLWKKDYAWVPCMCSWAKNQENSTDCSEKKYLGQRYFVNIWMLVPMTAKESWPQGKGRNVAVV